MNNNKFLETQNMIQSVHERSVGDLLQIWHILCEMESHFYLQKLLVYKND